MASTRVKHHVGVLEYIRDLNEKERSQFVKGCNSELLKTLSELCLNLLKGNICISPNDLKKLRKYKQEIITLSEKRHSLKKRRIVCSQKGGFIGTLISTILPTVIGAIISATQKRKR